MGKQVRPRLTPHSKTRPGTNTPGCISARRRQKAGPAIPPRSTRCARLAHVVCQDPRGGLRRAILLAYLRLMTHPRRIPMKMPHRFQSPGALGHTFRPAEFDARSVSTQATQLLKVASDGRAFSPRNRLTIGNAVLHGRSSCGDLMAWVPKSLPACSPTYEETPCITRLPTNPHSRPRTVPFGGMQDVASKRL